MNKKFNLKSFVLGACAAFTLTSVVTVGAMSIDVIMNDIKIYWDGVEKTLTNVRGEKVEPLIYQGTTYVPVRAMANLMGKDVDWNQADMAVYVGKKPTMRTISLADMESNINGRSDCYEKDGSFSLKNDEIKYNDAIRFYSRSVRNITYVLDGKFSRFTGKMVMPYVTVGSSSEETITFYSVENDGTKNEIKSYDLKQTQDPIEVDINLIGVTNLMIEVDNGYRSTVIYDANFLGE